MKCSICPAETGRAIGSILGNLCGACLELALAESVAQLESQKRFAEKYRHSPAFVLEFGKWILRGGKI